MLNDCTYVMLKDILNCQSDQSQSLNFGTSQGQQFQFEFKNSNEQQLWNSMINKLKQNEDISMDELIPSNESGQSGQISQISEQSNTQKSYYQKYFELQNKIKNENFKPKKSENHLLFLKEQSSQLTLCGKIKSFFSSFRSQKPQKKKKSTNNNNQQKQPQNLLKD
eukprot:TRINITY_DN4984_c0_g1_i2.p4 TRINITY_DN4984_c0_g1~~TRINITY_DN4984_c0_g1_i2.p4  ORF type:complete len:166 (-),score=32.92 TRINITY_DN4984_c0_g1_i2:878-1375(-)